MHCGLNVVTMEQHRTFCCCRRKLSAFLIGYFTDIGTGHKMQTNRNRTFSNLKNIRSIYLNLLIKDYLRHLSLILRLVLVEMAFLVPTLSHQTRMVLPSFTTPKPSSVACKTVRLHPMSFDWVLVNWLLIIASYVVWTIRTKNTSLPPK